MRNFTCWLPDNHRFALRHSVDRRIQYLLVKTKLHMLVTNGSTDLLFATRSIDRVHHWKDR